MYNSGCPNFQGFKIQEPLAMNIDVWENSLYDPNDNIGTIYEVWLTFRILKT